MSGGTRSNKSCSARREWGRAHGDNFISQLKSKKMISLAEELLLMHFVIFGAWIISVIFCMYSTIMIKD